MNQETVEKISEQGFTLKVNLLKNSYLVFKNNKPLINSQQESRSIIHKLSYFVFVGSEFDLSVAGKKLGELDFYAAQEGVLKIPFKLKDKSDIRHICLPLFLDCDLLPAVVQYYYRASIVGNLTQSKNANLFFILDANHDNAESVRLKIRFPRSCFVFFDKEKETWVEQENDDLHQGKLATTRVTDIEGHDDIGVLSQNPVFAARFYLRKLDWPKMKTLPQRFVLSQSDIETILVFFKIMKKNLQSKEEVISELEKTEKYYNFILPFFSMQTDDVDNFFLKYREEKELQEVEAIVQNQQKFHHDQMDRKKSNFYLYVNKKLEEARS